jgi:hypothetical protein
VRYTLQILIRPVKLLHAVQRNSNHYGTRHHMNHMQLAARSLEFSCSATAYQLSAYLKKTIIDTYAKTNLIVLGLILKIFLICLAHLCAGRIEHTDEAKAEDYWLDLIHSRYS